MDWINLPDGTCFDNAYAVLYERFLEAGYEEDAKDFNQQPSKWLEW